MWEALDELNRSLGKTLAKLRELASRDSTAYAKSVKYLSTLQTVQWLANPNMSKSDEEIILAFVAVHQLSEVRICLLASDPFHDIQTVFCQGIRQKMREMSAAAGVPIEPPEQTELLDACTSGAGVIGGGVPGGMSRAFYSGHTTGLRIKCLWLIGTRQRAAMTRYGC